MDDRLRISEDMGICEESDVTPDRMAVNSLLSIDEVHEYDVLQKANIVDNEEQGAPKDWYQKSIPIRKGIPLQLVTDHPTNQALHRQIISQLPQIRLSPQPSPTAKAAEASLKSQMLKKARAAVLIPHLPLQTAFPSMDSDSMPHSTTNRLKPFRKLTDPRYLRTRQTEPFKTDKNKTVSRVVFDGGQLVPPPPPTEKQKHLPSLPAHLVELAKSLFQKADKSKLSVSLADKECDPDIKAKQGDANHPWAGFRQPLKDKGQQDSTKALEESSNKQAKTETGKTFFMNSSSNHLHNGRYDFILQKQAQAMYAARYALSDPINPRGRIQSLVTDNSFSSNSAPFIVRTETSMDCSDTRRLNSDETRRMKQLGVKRTLKLPEKSIIGSNLIKVGLSPPSFCKSKTRVHNFTRGNGFTDTSGHKYKTDMFSLLVHNRSISLTQTGTSGIKPFALADTPELLRLNGITLYR
jgi:hypothetical protein